MKRTRLVLIVLAVGCCLAAVLYLARDRILPPLAGWLDVGDRPHAANYVFVLGGDLEVRPFVGAALYKAKLASEVLVPQVHRSPEVEAGMLPAWGELVKRVLVYRGVRPEDVILLGDGIDSTYDEARALADFLRSRPAARVTVVTSNFHTRRARWVFSQVLGSQMKQVSFFSAPTEAFQTDNWWRSEGGFLTILGENLKFFLYLLCYGRLAWWIVGIVCGGALLFSGRRWLMALLHRNHAAEECRL